MKRAFLIAAIVLGFATGGFAGERGGPHNPHRGKGDFKRPHPHRIRNVTPYGDFCPNCSVYGVRYKHRQVRHDKAIEAIRAYFAKRGFTIGNVRGIGRFIKVDVYRKGELVDRLVFDRKTGRIRSIY
jgi:hypothetical protein